MIASAEEWLAFGSPTVAGESFEAARAIVGSGRSAAMHEHVDAHLVVVVSGQWDDVGPAGRWSLGPGELLFHPAGFRHRTRAGADGAEIIGARIAPAVVARFCPLYGNIPRSIHLRCDRLSRIPDLLHQEMLRLDAATPSIVEGLLMQLLAVGSRVVVAENGAPEWLSRTLDVIRAGYARRLTIPGLAAAAGVSESRLVHGFRDITGRSVGDFIREVRVAAAARALRETNDAIADIALAAGFYDQAHLSKSFKAVRGMTPLAYRRVNSRKQRD